MNIIKAMAALGLSTVILFIAAVRSFPASADGEHGSVPASTEETEQNVPDFDFSGCRSAAVYECITGTLLAGHNEHDPMEAGHLSKLMTVLLTAEKINEGKLKLSDEAVCSKLANSQNDPQIWLDYGEKISIEELLKAICIGNANDADALLTEKISAKENTFTEILHCKVKSLCMNDTEFEKLGGYTRISRISANDVAKICAELVKYNGLTEYYTTWMDSVRNGKAELVSRNRLIRSYKGIKGFKVCFSKESGYCAAVCAQRGDMTVCVAIMGMDDEDALLSKCAKLLDQAFAAYEVYVPEVPEEALPELKISHGEKLTCKTAVPYLRAVVIRKGSRNQIKCSYEVATEQQAPIFEDTPVGSISFFIGDSPIASADICAAEQINEASFVYNLKRILLNLLSL